MLQIAKGKQKRLINHSIGVTVLTFISNEIYLIWILYEQKVTVSSFKAGDGVIIHVSKGSR